MKNISKNGEKLSEFLTDKMYEGKFNNADLVHFLELTGGFLNLKTIPQYAKENNLSYNGVKNNREIVEIFSVKFVVDNQ